MTILVEHDCGGADNSPSMLEKSLSNSWQNRMLLYIKEKEHSRMMLNFVLHEPLFIVLLKRIVSLDLRPMMNSWMQKSFKMIVMLELQISFFKVFHQNFTLLLTIMRSSSKLSRDQTSNPTSSTNTSPKGRTRRSSKQKVKNSNFEEHLPPVAMMADNRTMAEMLRAPTEGCADAIVVPSILAEQFELKHSFINMMTLEQFFGLEKENPHDHIRAARRWLEKEPPHLLRACPHHGFTELNQLDTFYNALNPADQDSLNAAAGRNLLEKSPQDALTIIENKSKVRNSRSKLIASQVKACDVNSNSEIAMLTHAVNQQTSVVTTAMTAMLKQLQATPTPAPVKAVKEICVTCGGLGSFPSNTVANPKGELKAITTRSGHVTYGPTVPTSPNPLLQMMLKQKQQEKNEVQIQKFWQMFKQLHLNITLAEALVLITKYQKMLKDLLSNKEKLQELANTPLKENCSAVILKKLLEKLGDPGKFLIPCDFSKLKCKVLADLGASINLMPLFTFPTDFVVVDYESDPRVPLILGIPFLRTARALIDVHDEEMILRDGDERLTLKMKHDTASYSNHPQRESVNFINIFNVSSEDFFKFDIESDLKEIEFLLYKGKDSSLKDSIDQTDLANLDDYFFDPTPEIFTDKHAPDYSSPPRFDVYDDDFLEVEFNADNDFSRVDALPSPNNEDKIFNLVILIHEKSVKIITRVAQEKKLARSNASLVLEDFDPPFCEPLFFKDVPKSKMLLPFSSENEEKIFKPGIYTAEKVHSCFLPELSHPGYHVFKVNPIFISLMKIFLVQSGKNTPILDVLLNDTPPIPENESSNFDHNDDPSFPRPPSEPSDVEIFFESDSGVLTTNVVKGISEHDVLMPNIFPTLPTFDLLNQVNDTLLLFSSVNEYKLFKPGIPSYLLVSQRDNTTFDFSENPMMMYGGDIPLLDISYLYFYPL
nr:hypothetical protein [Tanacetum cinerariifolium]